MRRSLMFSLIAFSLILSACTSGEAPVGSSSSSDSTVAGITVPDSYSPVVIRPLSDPTFPFKGTDGKYHIVYDLELQNASPIPATVEKLEVVDANDPKKVLASYSGKQLVNPKCDFGDCNRLRSVVRAAPVSDATMAPEKSRILFVDFTLESAEDAPKAVLHRFSGLAASGPAAKEATSVSYLVTPFDISAGTPLVLAPPVRGTGWVALNGCCEPGWPHRSSPAPLTGAIRNSQRFALDWKRINEQGQFFEGDKTKNESYVDYGEPILAVADGTVVSILDGMEANTPGTLPAQDPKLAAELTVENVDGNHIVLDLGNDVYALYAHLIKGSLKVGVGDGVKTGDQIAELGNTGNANASHLHFQLMNGPSLVNSDGLPYVISGFDYDGQLDPQLMITTDDYLSGDFGKGRLSNPEPRSDELPLAWAIVNFPS